MIEKNGMKRIHSKYDQQLEFFQTKLDELKLKREAEFEKLSVDGIDLKSIFGVQNNSDVVKLQKFLQNLVRNLK